MRLNTACAGSVHAPGRRSRPAAMLAQHRSCAPARRVGGWCKEWAAARTHSRRRSFRPQSVLSLGIGLESNSVVNLL